MVSYKKFSLIFVVFLYICSFLLGYTIIPVASNGEKVYNVEVLRLQKVNFIDILRNNLIVIIQLIVGALVFGLLTVINIVFNGLSFGFLVSRAFQKSLSLYAVASLTFPHGIFEIPAIIVAGAAGFKIPYEIVRYLMGKKEQPLTKEDIKEYITLALISIILIVIAAFVEAYITPRIAEYFLSKGI
jgi:uncharacterized membrane protein SpoIIM required for sporulation